MTKIGSYDAVDRHNRPNVSQRVALRAFFLNDGVYQDPVDISGVTLFATAANISPSSVVDASTGLLKSGLSKDLVRMHFASSVDATAYVPDNEASGIYKLGTGKYAVILDGSKSLSGMYTLHGSGVEVANTASSLGEYIDIWTVKLLEGSDYKSVINAFNLYADTFFTITQPLMVQTTNRLTTKKLVSGSKRDLKFSTEVSVENKDIDDSIINIFKDSAITSAMVQIVKVNDNSDNLPGMYEVSGYSDTSPLVDVTSDNTIICPFNADIQTLSSDTVKANIGGTMAGAWAARVKYNLVGDTIVTPWQHFIVS